MHLIIFLTKEEKNQMQIVRATLFGVALTVLALGAVGAEERTGLPAQPAGLVKVEEGKVVEILNPWAEIVKSRVNPLIMSTGDMAYSGGSVAIPFSLNQRARVWLAVYDASDGAKATTGARGPFGAWLRLQPGPALFVASTAGADFEAGNNVITWDGNDWEGNSAGAGPFEFDLVGLNILEDLSVAGIAPITGFADPWIDLRTNEVWMGEYDRDAPDWGGHRSGDIGRSVLGTDFIANPNAWERWKFDFGFEGARTLGGMRIDDQDPEIFWTSHHSGELGGLYKIRINRAAQAWDRVTDFGTNGHSPNANGDRIVEYQPRGDVVFNALWGRQEVPFNAVELRDKTTGEITQAFDVTEFYNVIRVDDDGNESVSGAGPAQISVTDDGIWVSSWAHPSILRLDHDGNVMWANRNGDLCGDSISNEEAAAIGALGGSAINNLGVTTDKSGNIVFINAGSRAATISALGRDGACAFELEFPASWGRMRPGGTRFNLLQEGGPYDGLYTRNGMRLETFSYGYGDDEATNPYGPHLLLYTPVALASGKLGAAATAVLEVAGANTPDAYSLGNATPNPFNPSTVIEFTVPDAEAHVKLQVFNAVGQLVATLADQTMTAGKYRADWDARNASGELVSSGVYYYRMEAGSFVEARPMTFLK
jgi:hypothetical protein